MSIWKDIHGYEGLYQVSDRGEVKSLAKRVESGRGSYIRPEQMLSAGLRGRGSHLYKAVVLMKNGKPKSFSVHRLVAMAFLDNSKGLPEVNHKDENTLNNCVENLEWCDRQYNIEYSKCIPIVQIKDGIKIAEYKGASEASRKTGILRTSINNALCGFSKSAGGYKWEYV